jgi:peptidoglycan pentaglycine glycine transferase (the first glycine)
MKIVGLSENEIQQYNQFVVNSPTGSFLQSCEWGEWQEKLGRKVWRFLVSDSDQIIAAIQLIKIPLPFGKYYLYAPYGPVVMEHGAWSMEHFLKELKFKCLDAVFVKIEPKSHQISQSLNFLFFKSSNVQPGKTLVIDLSKSEEEILAKMHPKTRYNIRLAEKHNVKVRSDLAIIPGHGLYFQEVIDQITETEQRQGFKGHGVGYYKNLVDFFALQKKSEIKIFIYKALNQNQLLACGIMLDFGKTRTYLFGGSSENNKNLMAPYLLHFQAMKDAKNLGLGFYDFWGIETSSGKIPGFARFKQGFAPQHSSGSASGIMEYAGAYDIPINKNIYWLYRLAKKVRS